MEQKSLEYDRLYVEFSNKPQWLLDVNPEGTVPVLKDDEQYIPDSGAIVEYLENKFPTPSVPVDEDGLTAGNGIFGAFRNFFLNKDDDEEESLKSAFEEELKKFNEKLKSLPGPFLGGATFNAADCLLLPRLYHAKTALGKFKKWTFPEDLVQVIIVDQVLGLTNGVIRLRVICRKLRRLKSGRDVSTRQILSSLVGARSFKVVL